MGDVAVKAVLRSRLHKRLKSVAVTFAHHANHHTLLAWCAVGTVAGYWGISGRSVQLAIRELERLGVLVLQGDRRGGAGRPARYKVDLLALEQVPERGHSDAWPSQGRFRVHPLKRAPGSRVARSAEEGRKDIHPSGPTVEQKKDDRNDNRGRIFGPQRVNAVSPEHSEQEEQKKEHRHRTPAFNMTGQYPDLPSDDAAPPNTRERTRLDPEELLTTLIRQAIDANPSGAVELIVEDALDLCRRTFLRSMSSSAVAAAVREHLEHSLVQ